MRTRLRFAAVAKAAHRAGCHFSSAPTRAKEPNWGFAVVAGTRKYPPMKILLLFLFIAIIILMARIGEAKSSRLSSRLATLRLGPSVRKAQHDH